MYIQIGLLILVLAAFVVAYFSARTWHWGHVVVLLGLFLATVGFFVLSAEVVRINAVLRRQVNELERQLTEVRTQTQAVVSGTNDPQLINQLRNQEVQVLDEQQISSLADLDHRLHLETRLRGKVWSNVQPVDMDRETGAVRVRVESPDAPGWTPETVVFVFEQGEPAPADQDASAGAQYLGQFRVTETAGGEATLAPLLPLEDFNRFARERLAGSRGPWMIYETMPIDQHKIFAEMSDEELRQKLPPQSVEEYLRHGEEAGPDDDEWHRVGYDETGKRLGPDEMDQAARVVYERRMRDYATEFDELTRQRIMLQADIAGVTMDNERLRTALASAQELQAFRQDEIRRLGVDLAGVTREREAIETHLAEVEQRLATAQQRLDETLAQNRQLAQQLAARQAGLREEIDGASTIADPPGPLALGTVN